jgi:hypothetical protein
MEAALHGRPANTGQVTDLIKLVIAPGTPINTHMPMEFTHTTLYLKLSTCKGLSLEVEAQAKAYLELRVESSLRSHYGSGLGDR